MMHDDDDTPWHAPTEPSFLESWGDSASSDNEDLSQVSDDLHLADSADLEDDILQEENSYYQMLSDYQEIEDQELEEEELEEEELEEDEEFWNYS